MHRKAKIGSGACVDRTSHTWKSNSREIKKHTREIYLREGKTVPLKEKRKDPGRWMERVWRGKRALSWDGKTRNGRETVVHTQCTCKCAWVVTHLMTRYNRSERKKKKEKRRKREEKRKKIQETHACGVRASVCNVYGGHAFSKEGLTIVAGGLRVQIQRKRPRLISRRLDQVIISESFRVFPMTTREHNAAAAAVQ